MSYTVLALSCVSLLSLFIGIVLLDQGLDSESWYHRRLEDWIYRKLSAMHTRRITREIENILAARERTAVLQKRSH